MARELENVIRVGAVNCADERALCRQQGIQAYPTLLFYPEVSGRSAPGVDSALCEYAAPEAADWSRLLGYRTDHVIVQGCQPRGVYQRGPHVTATLDQSHTGAISLDS